MIPPNTNNPFSLLISRINDYTYTDSMDLVQFIIKLIGHYGENGESVIVNDTKGIKEALDKHCEGIPQPLEQHRLHNELDKLQQDANILNTVALNNYTVLDIIYMISSIKEDISPYPFSGYVNFDYSNEELYDLKIIIQKYSTFKRFYNQEGLKANELEKYNKQTILNGKIEELKSHAKSWTNELDQITSLLLEGIQSIKEAHKSAQLQKLNTNLDSIESQIDIIDQFATKYQLPTILKPSILTFDKKTKQAYKDWQQILLTNSLDKDITSPDQAIFVFSERVEEAKQVYKKAKVSIQQDLKSLTELNTSNESILEGCNQLKVLLHKINDFQLYKGKLECNAYNINKIIEYIRTLRDDINIFLQHTHIQSAIDWYACKDELSSDFKIFLKQLDAIPQGEWKMQFEYYYLNTYLEQINIETYGKAVGLLDMKRASNTMEFKLAKDYIEFTKSDNSIVQWVNILEYNSLYNDSKSFISLDHNIEHPDCININQSDTPTKNTIPHQLEVIDPISDIHPSKLLSIIKKLAHNLLPYIKGAAGYQLKGGNVISAIHLHWQNDISDFLKGHGAKAFDISEFNSLVDFLLSVDRPLYIIIQDGLLSTHQAQDQNQFKLLDDLKSYGIHLVNLSSFDILKDKPSSLKSVFNQLPIVNLNQQQDKNVLVN